MTNTMSSQQLFALRWLGAGGELWVLEAEKTDAVVLRRHGVMHRLPLAVFDEMSRQDLLKPLRSEGASTHYELTARGWEMARVVESGEPPA